jgi:hypothetical protein
VKNTAYFDIAAYPFHRRVPGILHRPLAGGYAPRTRRTSQQGQSAAMPARGTTRWASTQASRRDGQVGAVPGWPGVTRPSEVDQ